MTVSRPSPKPHLQTRRDGGASADGIPARQVAIAVIHGVMSQGHSIDMVLNATTHHARLSPRDRAFARAIIGASLRRHGELNAVIKKFLTKPLPASRGRIDAILLSAAAQLLVLETPPHAAISLAVDQTRLDTHARRFDKLVNAVLRRVSEQGRAILPALDAAALNIPPWMLSNWSASYGRETAKLIAGASLVEAPLDVTVKQDAANWAGRLGGTVVLGQTIRLAEAGRVDELDGYATGEWWVQDAAASLPARMLGDVRGRSVADICAAPGGKSAQLAAAGACVTSVDQSAERLARLSENFERLGLKSQIVVADAATWSPGRTFDAVLADVPCTSTGTIRRHPDILHLKRRGDITELARAQTAILANAGRLVAPGGTLVYCSCSLEPEEGSARVADFLSTNPQYRRQPVTADELSIPADAIDPSGDLRTLPHFLAQLPPGQRGMDGFFASRLIRRV